MWKEAWGVVRPLGHSALHKVKQRTSWHGNALADALLERCRKQTGRQDSGYGLAKNPPKSTYLSYFG